MTISYIVEHDEDGTPEALYRFIYESGRAAVPSYLDKFGNWIEDWSLTGITGELHNPFYDEVSEEDAFRIAKERFGIELKQRPEIAA